MARPPRSCRRSVSDRIVIDIVLPNPDRAVDAVRAAQKEIVGDPGNALFVGMKVGEKLRTLAPPVPGYCFERREGDCAGNVLAMHVDAEIYRRSIELLI